TRGTCRHDRAAPRPSLPSRAYYSRSNLLTSRSWTDSFSTSRCSRKRESEVGTSAVRPDQSRSRRPRTVPGALQGLPGSARCAQHRDRRTSDSSGAPSSGCRAESGPPARSPSARCRTLGLRRLQPAQTGRRVERREGSAGTLRLALTAPELEATHGTLPRAVAPLHRRPAPPARLRRHPRNLENGPDEAATLVRRGGGAQLVRAAES